MMKRHIFRYTFFIGLLLITIYLTEKRVLSYESDIILIPAGEFIMGANSPEDGRPGDDYGVDEEPRHKVYLKDFYIDKYEVTIGDYREYLKATGVKWFGDSENLPGPANSDRHPVNYISLHDANNYCKWRGKRLPTEAEWEKAARGTDGRRWPWGNKFEPQNALVEETGEDSTSPVGSYPQDKSPYGVYDMAGNLSEWTSSFYLPYPGNKYDDGRYTKDAYVLKGGSYLIPGRLYARPAARSLAYPAYNHRMYGVRCARDAS